MSKAKGSQLKPAAKSGANGKQQPTGATTTPSIAELVETARKAMLELANHPDCGESLKGNLTSLECDTENFGLDVAEGSTPKAAPPVNPMVRVHRDANLSMLVDRLFANCETFTNEGDALARAIVKLVDLVAYEDDEADRDALAHKLGFEVYSRTTFFENEFHTFAVDECAAEFGADA